MFDLCREFRADWLESALDREASTALERRSEHLGECSACRSWLLSRRVQVQALGSLPRAVMPDRLAPALEGELVRPTTLVERALRSLPRREAPAELTTAVAGLLETAAAASDENDDRSRAAWSVRALDVAAVPPVLERLIAEELAEPEAHRVDRFVGNLEPQLAPSALQRRIERSLRQHPGRRLLFAHLVTLAAACLVAWVVLRGGDGSGLRERSFRVVRAQDQNYLDPLARGLAAGLSGGMEPEREGND